LRKRNVSYLRKRNASYLKKRNVEQERGKLRHTDESHVERAENDPEPHILLEHTLNHLLITAKII